MVVEVANFAVLDSQLRSHGSITSLDRTQVENSVRVIDADKICTGILSDCDFIKASSCRAEVRVHDVRIAVAVY